jgi:hypothetical protein
MYRMLSIKKPSALFKQLLPEVRIFPLLAYCRQKKQADGEFRVDW